MGSWGEIFNKTKPSGEGGLRSLRLSLPVKKVFFKEIYIIYISKLSLRKYHTKLKSKNRVVHIFGVYLAKIIT